MKVSVVKGPKGPSEVTYSFSNSAMTQDVIKISHLAYRTSIMPSSISIFRETAVLAVSSLL